jgi:hypothetical protein
VIVEREVHESKQQRESFLTEEGRQIDDSEAQLENA